MVEKFTLFELHLDDARFSNAVGGTPEAAKELIGEMDEDAEAAAEDVEEAEAAAEDVEESSGGPLGRRLRMAAFAVVVAVGIRTIVRRFLGDEEGLEVLDAFESEEEAEDVEVDLDESAEA